jgi:polysaccharide pyruvyl transferase WcaK-like protein
MQTSHTIKPRVAAFGEWNTTNLGDRAIFEGVLAFCQENGWEVDAYGLGSLTLISKQPPAASPLLHAVAPSEAGNKGLRSLHRLKDNHSYTLVKRSVRSFRQQLRIRSLLPQLKQAQVILVGGGSLLSDRDLHFPQSLAAISWAANHLQRPLLCLGCGAVEDWSPEGRAMIEQFAKTCHFIAARDHETAKRLTPMVAEPISIFGDFALTVNNGQEANFRHSAPPTIAVNVMQLFDTREGYQQRYEEVLIKAVNAWTHQAANQSAQIKVFTTGNLEDLEPAKRVAQQISAANVELYLPTSVDDLCQMLSTSTVAITARLHAAILSISSGVPVIGLAAGEVHRKLHNFFGSIGISHDSISAFDDNAVDQVLHLLNGSELKTQRNCVDLSEVMETRAKTRSLLKDLASLGNSLTTANVK